MFSVRELEAEVAGVDERYVAVEPRAGKGPLREAFELHMNQAQKALDSFIDMNVETISMADQFQAREFMGCRASLNRCHALIDLMGAGAAGFADDHRYWSLRGERVLFRNAISFLSVIRSKIMRHAKSHSPPPVYDSIVNALVSSSAFATHKRWVKRLFNSR